MLRAKSETSLISISFTSGSDDIDEEQFAESRRKVPPVPSNSHLHCHSSTLHLPIDAFDQTTDPKTQK